MRSIFSLAFTILLIGIGEPGEAALVNNRAELNTILAGSAITEDFETFSLAPDVFVEIGATLDHHSIYHGQGPGLVVPGIRFGLNPGSLQFYGTTVFEGNSQRLSFSATSAYLIDFIRPVKAFGIDLFSLPGLSGSPTIQVLGPDGNSLGSFGVGTVNDPQVPRFFGYEHAAGISGFGLTAFVGGPILDNVTFEAVVPEPEAITLLLIAFLVNLARRRRATNAVIER